MALDTPKTEPADIAPERPYHALTVIPDVEEKILARISEGKSLEAIGREFNVSHVAILHRVENHPDYKRLMRTSAHLRMERREMELEAADTNVTVTRADRLLGHARWLAERLARDTYGQSPTVAIDNHITIIHESK